MFDEKSNVKKKKPNTKLPPNPKPKNQNETPQIFLSFVLLLHFSFHLSFFGVVGGGRGGRGEIKKKKKESEEQKLNKKSQQS